MPAARDDVYPPCKYGGFRVNLRKFNNAEKAIMNEFKPEYLNAPSAAARRVVICEKICVALFKKWDEEVPGGRASIDEENVSKTVLDYIRNNWRTKAAKKMSKLSVKLSEVMWINHREEVYAEIYKMQNKPVIPNVCPANYFPLKSIAIGNVLRAKSAEALKVLKEEKRTMADEGLPLDLRAERCNKYCSKRIADADRRNWLEMGVLSITFSAGPLDGAQFGYTVHDNINKVVGIRCKRFQTQFRSECDKILRLLKVHVTKVNALAGLYQNITSATNGDMAVIKHDNSAFPFIANAPDDRSKCTRNDLLNIYRQYINWHYELATCHQFTAAPWADIAASPRKYIDGKHLPRDFVIRNQRDILKEDLITFIDWIVDRQKIHPIGEVFRFRMVNTGRGADQDSLKNAIYPDDPEFDEKAKADAEKNFKASKTKTKKMVPNVQRATLQQIVYRPTGEGDSTTITPISGFSADPVRQSLPSDNSQPVNPPSAAEIPLGSAQTDCQYPGFMFSFKVPLPLNATAVAEDNSNIDPLPQCNDIAALPSTKDGIGNGRPPNNTLHSMLDWDIASHPIRMSHSTPDVINANPAFAQHRHHMTAVEGRPPLGSPPMPPIECTSQTVTNVSMPRLTNAILASAKPLTEDGMRPPEHVYNRIPDSVPKPSLSALHDFTSMLPTPRNTASPAPLAEGSHRVELMLKKKKSRKTEAERLQEHSEGIQKPSARTRKKNGQ